MDEKNYKKAINQIHASEDLKNKTYEKIMKMQLNDNEIKKNTKDKVKKSKNKYAKISYLTGIAAMFMLVFFLGGTYLKTIEKSDDKNETNNKTYINIGTQKNDLPRFASLDELKNTVKKDNENKKNMSRDMIVIMDGEESILNSVSTDKENSKNESKTELGDKSDYSKTNNQVENVDEADIVKTDGKYIYYISQNKVYIVDAKNMEITSKIEYENSSIYSYLGPEQLFINENKLIVLGTYSEIDLIQKQDKSDEYVEDKIETEQRNFAQAIIYDISDKSKPKEIRKVSLDGYYKDSRMIGKNIYFISAKIPTYYTNITEKEILPCYSDTVSLIKQESINYTDIAYLKSSNTNSYLLVGGFNIENKEKVNIETFYGASADDIYVSEENMYITEYDYGYDEDYGYSYYRTNENNKSNEKTKIYKFNLKDSQIKLQCTGEVNGYLKNQFSMDEYEGNLRIAITSGYNQNSSNAILVFDKDLKEIGKIEDLAQGEKIYSVRFIGKIGYVVTFEQIDPLFVIDLSDPYNPVVKGQLKIPGYSSYLHPYDQTHIIGIGYNTELNGYGGVINTTLKMSMFDISDLENPKEIFNVSIGNGKSSSEIINEHKALFYNKQKNLIGFPVYFQQAPDYKDSFVIYKIDMEKGFEKYGEISEESKRYNYNSRMIYIGETIYVIRYDEIISYNMNDLKEIGRVELK